MAVISAKKVFLVVIRFSNENSNRAHLLEVAPLVKSIIEKDSDKECQLAYTDKDGYSFAWLLKTNSSARKLRDQLFVSDNNGKGCAIRNGDNLVIFEVGDEFDGVGFSNAWTWLQHHK